MLAWHFLREDGCLKYTPHTKVKVGQELVFVGEPILCQQGYHASIRAIDALSYAPGPIICRVEVGGTIVRGDDKLVATERTVLAMADATELLHLFACDEASLALRERRRAGDKIDPRSYAAIRAKKRWLRGEIDDKELAAAWDAAWDAVRDAAWDAARAAAWDAVRDAAWDAARAAAWAAAWAATRDAARAAAWDAARAKQNKRLERKLKKLLGRK